MQKLYHELCSWSAYAHRMMSSQELIVKGACDRLGLHWQKALSWCGAWYSAAVADSRLHSTGCIKQTLVQPRNRAAWHVESIAFVHLIIERLPYCDHKHFGVGPGGAGLWSQWAVNSGILVFIWNTLVYCLLGLWMFNRNNHVWQSSEFPLLNISLKNKFELKRQEVKGLSRSC